MQRSGLTLIAALLLGAASMQDSMPAMAAANDPALEFEVDFRLDEPVFYVGGPVTFALRLKLPPGANATAVSGDWYRTARVAWAPAGRGTSFAGANAVTPAETAAMSSRTAGAGVSLTPERRGDTAYFVLDPAVTRAMTPGRYELIGAVDVQTASPDRATTTHHYEHRAVFSIDAATTVAARTRLHLLTATYQVENQKNVRGAIRTLESGLRDGASPELNERLGRLYQSQGELAKAITANERYIAWARGAAPRGEHGPQEIADELEQVNTILRTRLAAERK